MEKRKGINEAFQVPNNEQGLNEIKVVKQLFKGTGYHIIIRGRNKDRRKAVEAAGMTYGKWAKQDCPTKLATHLAVYIVDSKTRMNFKQMLSAPRWLNELKKNVSTGDRQLMDGTTEIHLNFMNNRLVLENQKLNDEIELLKGKLRCISNITNQ